ncbi:MAG: 5'/3'-nucleotidase SurE [Flavobacteriales bacterium]|nr:5'/3'-nucleotidase SurE [Flavobacteriales bacterium]MBP9079871.1 5'/3'-nucleotidase SurE [Flavobacteriales bacterium]
MNKTDRPLILVTNDDGIFAPGIQTLAREMQAFGEVLVVAPDKPQSAMGHAITIHNFLRLRKVDFMDGMEAYSCTGTPVDCVKLAVYHLIKGRPALLVSGINHGSNLSINVLYSGTMSAAVEGALEGIPSIGFSLMEYGIDASFAHTRAVVRSVTGNVLRHGLRNGSCLNVNIPPAAAGPLKGIRVCRQAPGHWADAVETRRDPAGHDYHWLKGEFIAKDQQEDTDVWATGHGYASVVPVQFDMTAHQEVEHLNAWDHAL